MKSKMAVTARYFKIELNIRPYWKNYLKIYFSGSIEPYTRKFDLNNPVIISTICMFCVHKISKMPDGCQWST